MSTESGWVSVSAGSGRAAALERWWSALGPVDRAAARTAAAAPRGGDLPAGLLPGLLEAGVLAVARGWFVNVSSVPVEFPMPADIRAHVLAQP